MTPNLPVYGPGIVYVPLVFDPAGGYPISGTGFISNLPVKLNGLYRNVQILCTNQATTNPENNIFLHFAPFVDNLGSTNASTGRLIQLGAQVNVFPLEIGVSCRQYRKYRFACGIPQNVFLSGDFQGTGNNTKMVAFYNDDLDVTVYPFTP